MPLPRGLYERLVTELLEVQLNSAETVGAPDYAELRAAEAADRIALHIATVAERAVRSLPDDERVRFGVRLARLLIDRMAAEAGDPELSRERPVAAGRILRALRRLRPDGVPADVAEPLIPLLDTTLLTNAPGEPRVGHQILAEIGSADRIDVVMAFIRRTGILPLQDALRRHVADGRKLRVLTTTYTGSTELHALDLLRDLGADVRVSYDTTGTRLHAKAWLFHRESGYSTAYVGSSNLTHSAQVSGLEWNVRVSGARNQSVIEKIAAVFESYLEQPEFEPFDHQRFANALGRDRQVPLQIALSPIEIRLEPFQERLLEQLALARQRDRHRNLLVAATGTGKTVMAAVDYARLREHLPRARLLFVAHREEILQQSRATFAHALRDVAFGEFWVGGARPREFEYVFASIQSLTATGLDALDPSHFDVVIIDEFHHAAAASYARLLDHLAPVELLGLTATPERSDGVSVLRWFDDRIAAELRLWDAIDQHRLVPFAYFGIADELDLRSIPWRRGQGYDVEELTGLVTSTDVWARHVLKQLGEHAGDISGIRALGFCVGVAHARYMERVFKSHGVPAVAVWSETPDDERRRALEDLAARRVNVVFSVDLFNEGVDVPSVDTLLMLRPTASPLLFLQQLGRGLRKSRDKSLCTVLDFIGQHRREFHYHRRFQALLGGSRSTVARYVESGFPFLPAGCHMELDRIATERVLDSIRRSVPTRWADKAEELRTLAAEQPELSLGAFLDASGLELEDVYNGFRSWSDLREAAGIGVRSPGPHEESLRRACGRLLHVDDSERLDTWRGWLEQPAAPRAVALADRERRLLRMLLVQMLDQVVTSDTKLQDGADIVWSHPQMCAELVELFDVLSTMTSHMAIPLAALPDVPLQIHARHTRLEILAAVSSGDRVRVPQWREGVRYERELPADVFVFTLDKTSGQFSPTTRYRDYAVSRSLIHWESQSGTSAESNTGTRYQQHAALGSHVLLFCRQHIGERAFYFLGPASYEGHEGEKPMAVRWRLQHPLPGDLFQAFAAAVA